MSGMAGMAAVSLPEHDVDKLPEHDVDKLPGPEADYFSLLDLPNHVLLNILQWLDCQSLCAASRCCLLLSRMAAHPTLWPHFKDDGWAVWDVRCTLARILRLPPQVFHVQLDAKRSRRFPITVPLHNLRPILNITDTEGLADRVSKAVQDQITKMSSSLWCFGSWQQLPPAASISIFRADRATVRASLRPEAVVPRLVQQLQQAGWPPPPRATVQAAAAGAACTAAAGSRGQVGGRQQQVVMHQHHMSPPAAPPASPVAAAAGSSRLTWTASSASGQLAVDGALYGGAATPWLGGSSSSSSSSSSVGSMSAAAMMSECLQVCRSRLELLSDGGLPQLAVLCGGRRPFSPRCCEPRERLALQRPAAAHMAIATSGKLPDTDTCRQSAASQLSGLEQQAADSLAAAAVHLMYVGAAAEPSRLSFSLPGKPGWMLMLQQAVKVVARLHTLQQICMCQPDAARQQGQQGQHPNTPNDSSCGSSAAPMPLLLPPALLCQQLSACAPAMEAAWTAAAAAELQLCLAGLQEVPRTLSLKQCTPATVFRCAIALEAAAAEFACEWGQLGSSDSVPDATRRMGVLAVQGNEQHAMSRVLQAAVNGGTSSSAAEQTGHGSSSSSSKGVMSCAAAAVPSAHTATQLHSHQGLVRCAMHVETLRSLAWCLWLLGVVD